MAALIAGIVILLLAWLLPLPYVLWVIGLIIGVVLVLYGLWVLLLGGPRPPAGTRRGVRWY
ncbi:membrane protein [Mycobacterium phage Saguaro]|uniref:Membrane protein n=1 Tax=Mycobacterium phage Saguaro TaxID=2315616 RepID=A0A386KCM6_9CAUD|nr:membrane protein [Mycobacterium phage Saguaro]AYD82016.1 membrane protein [Mycobacterium phage Saguaro]